MKIRILFTIFVVVLFPSFSARAQTPAPAPDASKEKPKRTLRLLVAGVRPVPAFEQRGDKVVEVEPAVETIPPTSLELLGSGSGAESGAAAGKAESKKFSAWPNEMVVVPGYKGSAQAKLRLLRPLIAKAHTPPEVTCELAEMTSPLILLSAGTNSQGWQSPVARVVDLAPAKLPARSVLFVNLSRVPLKARFDETGADVGGEQTKVMQLAANGAPEVRFRVDAMSGETAFPIVNSTYQLAADARLIVLALPNAAGAQGAAPVSLKMLVDVVETPAK